MNLLKNTEIKKLYDSLEDSMMDYLSSTTSYTKKDVKKSMKIIDFYLREIECATIREEGLFAVEKTVKMLNLLNKDCYHELIETYQRDCIAQLMNLTAVEKGFNDKNEDLTEKWRKW
jgi:hypothetical protein